MTEGSDEDQDDDDMAVDPTFYSQTSTMAPFHMSLRSRSLHQLYLSTL